jgi:hypothetical protein
VGTAGCKGLGGPLFSARGVAARPGCGGGVVATAERPHVAIVVPPTRYCTALASGPKAAAPLHIAAIKMPLPRRYLRR